MKRTLAAIMIGLLMGVTVMVNCESQTQDTEVVQVIELPDPTTDGQMSVEEAISRRRSIRRFAQKELTAEEMGQLAWSAQGITEPAQGLRAAPSAGATYPLEMYLVTPDGLFHYRPRDHSVLQLGTTDLRADLASAALGQEHVRDAPADIVITGIYDRTAQRYGERARRYVHMEAGHAAENIHLQAVALGLGSVPVGAFNDSRVSDVLDLPADEAPLYIIPVGHPQ